MAITIIEQPYNTTPSVQKLMVIATSDNVANDGFQYYFKVRSFAAVVYDGYLSPVGTDNALKCDVSGLIQLKNDYRLQRNNSGEWRPAHSFTCAPPDLSPEIETEGQGRGQIEYEINEAWIIAGVLTVSSDPPVSGGFQCYAAIYQPSEGYRPDPAVRYGLNGSEKRWLSDRAYNTHKPENTLGMDISTEKVFIPVREKDYGLMSMTNALVSEATQVIVTIIDSGGTSHSFSLAASAQPLAHYPVYPGNLNDTTEVGVLHPSSYPGWRYISIQAQDDGNVPKSVEYIMYNTAVYGGTYCRFDNVRVAWQGSGGGWEYFNFNRMSQVTNKVERKTYNKVLGDYSGSLFTMNPGDRGTVVRNVISTPFIQINSGPIQENEFIFLNGLINSPVVDIVNDDGTFTPMVVKTDSFTLVKDRKAKLKFVTLELEYAQPVW